MKTILVPIDFSPVTDAVVAQAATLARSGHGQIVLVHVVQPPVLVTEYGGMFESIVPLMEAAEKAAAKLLERWQTRLRNRRIVCRTVRLEGTPGREILRQAELQKPSYIVIGSHGRTALYELLVGSTTRAVLKRATGPVIVVPAKPIPGRKSKKK